LCCRDAVRDDCYQHGEAGQTFLHLPVLTVLPKKSLLRSRPLLFGRADFALSLRNRPVRDRLLARRAIGSSSAGGL
jgi:hypothetical protein